MFIHHNTLHALEHLPFGDAVAEASHRLGAEPWLPVREYRAALARGRITEDDLRAVHAQDEAVRGDSAVAVVPGRLSCAALRWTLLRHGVELEPDEVWRHREREGLLPMDLQITGLRSACREKARRLGVPATREQDLLTHRERVVAAGGADVAATADELLIPALGAWLDHGQAVVAMPGRDAGLYAAVRSLWLAPFGLPPTRFASGVRRRLSPSPETTLAAALDELGVEARERDAYLERVLLELPGWAGMIAWHDPSRLLDYAALRLAIQVAALATDHAPLDTLRARLPPPPPVPALEDPADVLADALDRAGIPATALDDWPDDAALAGLRATAAHDVVVRRRLLHTAYERHAELVWLGALVGHVPAPEPSTPAAQVVTCLDEREESFRRAVEETAPEICTFGAPGFFSIAVRYQGVDEPEATARCPLGVEPAHTAHEQGGLARRWPFGVARMAERASRTLLGGAALSVLGPLVTGTLAAQTLAPRLAPRRIPGPIASTFTPAEAADRIGTLFATIGLTRAAPVVVIVGHGSTSANNPHASAYDCGACGGFPGLANARLFAALANDPLVRAELAARGRPLPDDTVVVGVLHDTATDEIVLADPIAPAHRERVDAVMGHLRRAATRNARERTRRFERAPVPDRATAHVRARAASLAEPRPELGHATNAIAVIGRRARTRGLFLDRRAFLISYDPDTDPEGDALRRLVGVIPVMAGISLEYWFSRMDGARYGSGTKLPHNVVGGFGVMDGSRSDLRTGLPRQMVEIHEPTRLLVIVEAPVDRLVAAIAAHAEVDRLVRGRWIGVAALQGATLHRWRGDRFVPEAVPPTALPVVPDSEAWFARHLHDLPPARIARD